MLTEVILGIFVIVNLLLAFSYSKTGDVSHVIISCTTAICVMMALCTH